MPPLHHTIPGESFGWEKSEVAKWLFQQPEILRVAMITTFDEIKNRRIIEYNPATGTWQGDEYDGD